MQPVPRQPGPLPTDAKGAAVTVYRSTTSATHTITASGAGFSKTVSLSVVPGTASPANSSMTLASPVTAGTNAAFTVTEKDGSGNLIAGRTVTVACSGGATPAYTGGQVTNASGQISGTVTSNVAGNQSCTASDGGATFAQARSTSPAARS